MAREEGRARRARSVLGLRSRGDRSRRRRVRWGGAGSFAAWLLLGLCLIPSAVASDRDPEPRSLLLATTTSVQDSGLLDALLPDFTERTGITVRVVAVGTGAALRMGREGNADVLLTHAPEAERALVEEGVVRRRTPIMANYFVIAGPEADPADVATAGSPEEALRRIARTRSPWISRADDSGTHKREKSLWRSAGLDPEARWPGSSKTGSGMGASLLVAGERRAYILSDIGTFLAFRERIDLVPLSQPSESLRNVYSILQLDGARFERPIETKGAEALERYLLDPSVQARIRTFGVSRFGRPLFEPLGPTSARDPA